MHLNQHCNPRHIMIIKQDGFQSDPPPADGCDHTTNTHWLTNLGIHYCHFSTFHSTNFVVGPPSDRPNLYCLHCHSVNLHRKSSVFNRRIYATQATMASRTTDELRSMGQMDPRLVEVSKPLQASALTPRKKTQSNRS